MLKRNGNIALAPEAIAGAGNLPAKAGLAETEAAMLRAAVAEAHGNLAKAARLLGITRPKLVYRLQKHGIAAQ